MTSESSDSIRKQPSGISGKAFVMPFVVLLVFLCYLMFAVAVRFQTIMARLEEVRSLWPNASRELVPRYDRLNDIVANSEIPDPIKKEWEANRQEFGVSSQFDRQSVASAQIENQIRAAAIDTADKNREISISELDSPGISQLMEAEVRRKNAQNGPIGWLTVQGLRLRLPPIYQPLANQR